MKSGITGLPAIPVVASLILSFFLLPLSGSAFADHNGKTHGGGGGSGGGETGGSATLSSVVIDYTLGQINITGADLASAAVFIAGAPLPSEDVTSNTATNVTINFSAASAAVVTSAGNYALEINGVSSLVYFSGAIYDPTVAATCPCEAVWDPYRENVWYQNPPGYNGLSSSCDYLSPSGDEAVVYVEDSVNSFGWIMFSKYDSNIKQCAQYGDEPPVPLTSQAEHNACVDYLDIWHFGGTPGSEPCVYPTDLPLPLPWQL